MRFKSHVAMVVCLLAWCTMSVVFVGDGRAGTAAIDWNDKRIQWLGYKEGISKSRKTRKPAIVVFYADWCPACKKYGNAFKDKRVAAAASDFVMIRVNIDRDEKLSAAYGFDGEYVPRTFAVSPGGKVMHHLFPSKKYRYYIGSNPDTLLSLMQRALSGK